MSDNIALPTGYPDEAWDHALSQGDEPFMTREEINEAYVQFFETEEDEIFTTYTREDAFKSYIGYRYLYHVDPQAAAIQLSSEGPLSFTRNFPLDS